MPSTRCFRPGATAAQRPKAPSTCSHAPVSATASAIGDDRLQKQAQGYVVPDAFTHGTSEQRQRWFTTGLKEGKISSCDTFAAAQL